MPVFNLFLRLLLILLALAGIFFLIFIALGKAIQQKAIRDSIRRFNRQKVNPITLRNAGKRSSNYAIVTHVGRRSGCTYTTPVATIPFGKGFVIPLPYGTDTDWCRNVMTAGKCTLRWHDQEYTIEKPKVVPLQEVVSAFPLSLRITAATNGVKHCLLLQK